MCAAFPNASSRALSSSLILSIAINTPAASSAMVSRLSPLLQPPFSLPRYSVQPCRQPISQIHFPLMVGEEGHCVCSGFRRLMRLRLHSFMFQQQRTARSCSPIYEISAVVVVHCKIGGIGPQLQIFSVDRKAFIGILLVSHGSDDPPLVIFRHRTYAGTLENRDLSYSVRHRISVLFGLCEFQRERSSGCSLLKLSPEAGSHARADTPRAVPACARFDQPSACDG